MDKLDRTLDFTSESRCADPPTSDAPFENAWRTTHFDLERRAMRLVKGDRTAADELVADTALKTLLYMRRMPTRIRNPEGFLFVVLNHVFLDSVRHADREDRVMSYSANFDADYLAQIETQDLAPSNVLELSEELLSIATEVERLPVDQRRLFEMKFEEEMSYAAIASQLHINEALARKRVELLRRKLRKAAGNFRIGARHGRSMKSIRLGAVGCTDCDGDYSLDSRSVD